MAEGPTTPAPPGGGSTSLPRPILLVLHDDASVRILDPERRQILRTLSFIGPAGGIGASVDGNVGFVSGAQETGGGALYQMDLVRGTKEEGFVAAIRGLAGLTTDPDGDVWVAVNFSANVLEIDPRSQDDGTTRIETPSRNVANAFLIGTDRVIAAGAGGVTIIDVATRSVIRQIETDELASDIAVTADEAFAYVTHGVNTLFEISTATNTVTRTLRFAETPGIVRYPSQVAVVPDGTEVLVTSTAAEELVAVDRVTFEVSRRRTMEGAPSDIVVTPDNAFAYVSIEDRDEIAIIDLVTFKRSGGLSTGSRPAQLVWVSAGGIGLPDPPASAGG